MKVRGLKVLGMINPYVIKKRIFFEVVFIIALKILFLYGLYYLAFSKPFTPTNHQISDHLLGPTQFDQSSPKGAP